VSQNADYYRSRAARFIEEHLDATVSWEEVEGHLEAVHGRTRAQVSAIMKFPSLRADRVK
jgi:hypothetical protein